MRIVSLLPSATEIVFALGLGDQLEGVTYECDFPPEARQKRVISNTALAGQQLATAGAIDAAVRERMDQQQPIYALDEARIRDIQPDLILAQDLCRVCAVPSGQVEEALEQIGCESTVISLDPYSIEEILDGILEVGRATGTEARARELVYGLTGRVEAIRRIAGERPAVKTLCLEWMDPPFVGGHWIPGMVGIAGGANLLNEPRAPSRVVEWQDVAAANPEVIVFMPCGYDLEAAEKEGAQLWDRPEVADAPTGREGRVFVTDATAYFSRPGPRIVDGLEMLAWALHPDAFPEAPGGGIKRLERV